MKQKLIIVMLMALGLGSLAGMLGCNKEQQPVTGKDNYGVLSGTASYVSYYGDDSTRNTLDSQVVYLEYADGSGTLLHDITDSAGHFYFRDLDVTRKYRLRTLAYVRSSPVFEAPYYGEVAEVSLLPTGRITCELFAVIDSDARSGIGAHYLKVATTDSFGGRVGNIPLQLYYSGVFARADTLFSGTGSISVLSTDVNGRALIVLNGAAMGDSLFVRAQMVLPTGDTLRSLNAMHIGKRFSECKLALKAQLL